MKHLFKLLIIIFLAPLFSYAQSNFKPGYVVNMNGDTVKGYVDYKEWNKNPEKIAFKRDLNGQPESFTAQNITAFAISGFEYFKSLSVHISQDQVQMSNIKMGVDTSYVVSVVFLRMLSTGNNITLFSYTDDIKTRYYILDASDALPNELVYRVYYAPESFGLVQTQNRFRQQLEYYAKKYNVGSSKLGSQIETAPYQEADLVKIVQAINGNTTAQFTPQRRVGTQWHAGIGVANNSLGFKGTLVYPAKNSIFPTALVGFDIFPDKSTQKLDLRIDLSLMEDQHSYAMTPQAGGTSTSLSNVKRNTISFAPQILYNLYNSPQLNVFIDAGLSANFSHYNNYYFTESEYSGVPSTVTPQFPELRSFYFSIPVKAGVTLNKKVEIYAGYTLNSLITGNTVAYSGNLITYQAGINYLFGVK